MTTNRVRAAGDTWLTPGDAELLHALAGSLPAEVRRGLAQVLRRAGAVPDVVAASMRARVNQGYAALLHRLPAFVAEVEQWSARGATTPAQVEWATAELARYDAWAAGIAAGHHLGTELGQTAHAELAHARSVLADLRRLGASAPRRSLAVTPRSPAGPVPPRAAP